MITSYFRGLNAGVYGEMATPVPIPNTEVKHLCVDGTCPSRGRESRTTPASRP
jgi:hypothetical protein